MSSSPAQGTYSHLHPHDSVIPCGFFGDTQAKRIALSAIKDTAPPCLLGQCITNKPIAALLRLERTSLLDFC